LAKLFVNHNHERRPQALLRASKTLLPFD